MKIEQRSTFPVACDRLWDFLMDIPTLAACVPGVEQVTASGHDTYAGSMRVRVGPIGLTLQGSMTIDERDAAAARAALHAEATDRRVGGGFSSTAEMSLIVRAPRETELLIRADARLLGKLGEFGQPLIRKKIEAIMAEFARNVAAQLAAADP